MILGLFWLALALIVYVYIIFPLLIVVRGKLFPRNYYTGPTTPSVSLIIAAYNEADSIGHKLDKVLSLGYPSKNLEVIVASDGSTDGTNEIVQSYASRGVKLLALPRQGKAAALNTAVANATNEILVFSDANSIFAPRALHNLVAPFVDDTVGGVAGNQLYLADVGETAAAEGEKSYWKFDRLMKHYQSVAGNVISATGALYAIRKKLFMPVPEGVTDDFVTSTRVIAQGKRLVFAPEAAVFEPVAAEADKEFGRKVRVITRGLWAVILMRQLLNPLRHGFYSLQLFSHKVLRRLVVFPLAAIFITSALLWNKGIFFQMAFLGQLGFYGLATLGLLLEGTKLGQSKLFSLPYYFCLVNMACLLAVWNVIRGRRIIRWNTMRSELEKSMVHAQPSEGGMV